MACVPPALEPPPLVAPHLYLSLPRAPALFERVRHLATPRVRAHYALLAEVRAHKVVMA